MKSSVVRKLVFVLITLFSFSTFAQVNLGSLKRSAGRSLENAVERKIDSEMNKAAERAVNKYWDRVLGKYYSGLYEGGTTSSGSRPFPFMITDSVKIEDTYSFDRSVKMRIDTYKKNGKLDESTYMLTRSSSSKTYMCTEILEAESEAKNEELYIINDFENEAMVMLMEQDGEKMKLSYGLNLNEQVVQQMVDDQQETAAEIPEFVEIGSKDILGYSCKGYKTETEDAVTEIWVADTDVFGLDNMFGAKGLSSQNPQMQISGYPSGSLMEFNSVDKSGKKTVWQIIEMDDSDNLTLVVADYASPGEVNTQEGKD